MCAIRPVHHPAAISWGRRVACAAREPEEPALTRTCWMSRVTAWARRVPHVPMRTNAVRS